MDWRASLRNSNSHTEKLDQKVVASLNHMKLAAFIYLPCLLPRGW